MLKIKRHIPEHNCEQEKKLIGTGSSSKGICSSMYECRFCKKTWTDERFVPKTMLFEVI